MQYQEAVTEARTLVKRSEDDQWRLAQLTWEQLQAGHTQERWADDIGVSRRHVRRIAAVWEKYRMASLANRPRWTDAVADVDPATRLGGEPQTREAMRSMPPERKAEIVREALADPDVAKHTFNAPEPDDETAAKARMHAGSAISRHDQRIQEHIQEKRHDESKAKGRTDQEALYEVSAMMQVLADVVVTGGKLAHKLSEGATLSSGMRQTLAGYATKAKATIEWLEGIEDQQHAEDVDEVLRVWAAEA